MLQIRLSKGPSVCVGGSKPLPVETVTVACPDHLVLADLPVAKSLGSVAPCSLVNTVGRRSRRHLGERVHFCVRCDYPIAIYGRLSPCDHAFCLDCARSDSICYLCDERIQKIQTIKMMEGIFICAAPHCLKSFMKRIEFETHIHENHGNLIQPSSVKDDGNESEIQSIKQLTASEYSIKKPPFSPSSHSQSQPRSNFGQVQSNPPDQFYDKPQGVLSETLIPNYGVPVIPNPQFSYPPFTAPHEGIQPIYIAPYDMCRVDSALPEGGQSLPVNFLERPWNGQTNVDSFANLSDSQRPSYFQGGVLPSIPPAFSQQGD